MKKRGIINAQLSGLIAGLGHKDTFMIADGGMPIPKGVTIVDLALCGGVPTFQQVMDAVLEEVEVEFYKEMSKDLKFAIRTGEFTPYPNMILRAGVAF